MQVAAAFTIETSRVTLNCGRPRLVVLKTEKTTLVPEGIGDGKIPLRCRVLGGREGHP
jgi:hypothetical protein